MKFRSVIQDAFSTAEAARLSSLTPRQLDHWARLGFLLPSVRAAAGYGSKRRYSFSDVVKLRVASRLRASGVGLPKIRRCVEVLKKLASSGEADLAQARLIVTGNRVLWARSDREVVDLLRGGQLVLVFPVGDAIEETFGAVARLQKDNESANCEPRAAGHGKRH
jgi:DNA-binding transcriptional MerR regulator